MKTLLSLDFELNHELMTTLRLTTGGICSLAGLVLEETEDCKVCVTESLLLIMHNGYPSAHVSFIEDGGIHISIEAKGKQQGRIEALDDGISSALLCALAEDVNMQKENDCLKAIEFRFVKNGR